MTIPKSRDEALAKGFKPVEDMEVLARKLAGKSAHEFVLSGENLVAGPIDCNDPANDGKPCRVLTGGNGKVIIFYCTGGACSPAHALIGPTE